MSRNLRDKMGLSRSDAARLEELMNDYLEYALVEIVPEDLAILESVEMDAKDRHVLAAAISADADILLTENTAHFPREWMADRGIELHNAGELLTHLAERYPDKVRAAHEQTVRHSPKSGDEVLATLERIAGVDAVAAIRDVVG